MSNHDRLNAASDVVARLGERKGQCHFCSHDQYFEIVVELGTRCAHSPVGVCKQHLQHGVKYALSCVDAGDYVYVGVIGVPASERQHVQH